MITVYGINGQTHTVARIYDVHVETIATLPETVGAIRLPGRGWTKALKNRGGWYVLTSEDQRLFYLMETHRSESGASCAYCSRTAHYWSGVVRIDGGGFQDVTYHCQAHRAEARNFERAYAINGGLIVEDDAA